MEPSDSKHERQQGELGEAWQVLAEFLLPMDEEEEILVSNCEKVTESTLQTLQLPQGQVNLLKNTVSQAARNARAQNQTRALPGAGGITHHPLLLVKFQLSTSKIGGIPQPAGTPTNPQAWGYFLIQKRVAAGLQEDLVIELFLYPEGSV